jgi:hypothetical protein
MAEDWIASVVPSPDQRRTSGNLEYLAALQSAPRKIELPEEYVATLAVR